MEITDAGARFRAGGMELTAHTAGKRAAGAGGATVERSGDGLKATFTLREAEPGGGIVVESMGGEPRARPPAELDRLSDERGAFWRGWLSRSTYRGRWREMVSRSAMTLKLLTCQPTGAPVAAATFGLPEQARGERNWDYRCARFLYVDALARSGRLEDAISRSTRWRRTPITWAGTRRRSARPASSSATSRRRSLTCP
jgi:hypothetical protein